MTALRQQFRKQALTATRRAITRRKKFEAVEKHASALAASMRELQDDPHQSIFLTWGLSGHEDISDPHGIGNMLAHADVGGLPHGSISEPIDAPALAREIEKLSAYASRATEILSEPAPSGAPIQYAERMLALELAEYWKWLASGLAFRARGLDGTESRPFPDFLRAECLRPRSS